MAEQVSLGSVTSEGPRYLDGRNYKAWKVTDADFRGPPDLVKWAILAPSSHNTQPWQFETDSPSSLIVSPDLQRALPASDKNRREMYLSLGGAIANLKIAGQHFGYSAAEEVVTDPAMGTVSKRLTFEQSGEPPEENHRLFDAITRRVSNRGSHTTEELPTSFRTALLTQVGPDVYLELIEDPERKTRIGELVDQGDNIIMSSMPFTRELSQWAHPNDTKKGDGMPGHGFTINGGAVDDIDSQMFPDMIRSGQMGPPMGAADRELIAEKTAAIGVISTQDDSPEAWMRAGEEYQKIALEAASRGLATHVLAVLVETGDLRTDLMNIAGTTANPQIMFRVGEPELAVHHSPRRHVREVSPIGFGQERAVMEADKAKLITLDAEHYSLDALVAELGKDVEITDKYGTEWLTELFNIRNPDLRPMTPEWVEQRKSFVKQRNNDCDGNWVYFPWKHELVHILPKEEFYELTFSRNNPVIKPEEQRAMSDHSVGVIGLSIGGNIARSLAMTGIGRMKIADFDRVAPSNTPRMDAVSVTEIGENKAELLAHELQEFNPYLDLEIFKTGVHLDNLEEFMQGVDVLDDHMDDLEFKIRMREFAKAHDKVVMMATALGFRPTFEIELPEDPIFNGRVTHEEMEIIMSAPPGGEVWSRNAAKIMGIEHMTSGVIDNFLQRMDHTQNWGSQTGATGLVVGGVMAYVVLEMVRGNLAKMPKHFVVSMQPPEMIDHLAEERAVQRFKEKVGVGES